MRSEKGKGEFERIKMEKRKEVMKEGEGSVVW